ncbi:MAG: hypothetical protein ABI562_04360 [Chloroflexota bacterium]
MSPTARPFRFLAVIVIAFVALGCSGKTPPTAAPSAPTSSPTTSPTAAASAAVKPASDAWLVAGRAGEDGLEVIRSSTSERLIDLPTGIPDPIWGRLVTASVNGSTTIVRDLTVQPGFGGASQTLAGSWRLPTLGAEPMPVGISGDGRTIVLVEAKGAASSGTSPTSRFAVLRRTFDAKPRMVELAGSFEYDALAPDGSVLYVVEHLPGPPDGHYQVRAIDTATGVLRDGVVVDKAQSDEAMAGWPIGQVRRPDGMVFTLYHGAEHPFIHALSSIDAWALCIDLPSTGADDAGAAMDWGLAVTRRDALIAVNATLGLAAEIPLSDLAVRKSVTFTPLASTAISLAKFGHQPGGPVGRRVVVSPLGSAIYAAGSGGIVRLDLADLSVSGRFLEGVAVDAMAVTPDGGAIYALVHSGGRIVQLDPASGRIVGQVPGEGYDRLVAVVPW